MSTNTAKAATPRQSAKESALGELQRKVSGQVILPHDGAYESARRIWNAMIDKRPAFIVRCASTADVVHAVNFARDQRLPLAVRGGGHNIAGNAICDNGVVIDLSQMKAAKVDPFSRRAIIEGGALLADLDAATQAHGLATPAASTPLPAWPA
jgi:FAD/FMN-containing dehydrogenase